MLKKCIPLVFAAVAALAPVRAANAWDEVCVKLPLWKTWFSAKFAVVHDFDQSADGSLPAKHPLSPGSRPHDFSDVIPNSTDTDAKSAVYSGKIAVNQSRCVDISGIPNGEPFFVFVLVDSASISSSSGVVCETHPSNPNRFYNQQNRPYSKMWFESWGPVWGPKCKFTNESN